MSAATLGIMSTLIIILGGMMGYFAKRVIAQLDRLIDKVGVLVTDVATLKVRVHFLENKSGIVAREETKDYDGN